MSDPHGMKAWARRQKRRCPRCSRLYIAPGGGVGTRSGQWYKSERKCLGICWRCERAQHPTERSGATAGGNQLAAPGHPKDRTCGAADPG